ncbi:hypothetical protein L6452_41089 [Arctium lappa]|uniref:Uncharacterized protein n=1 Tax=Arctium lappa TaxID=4217 RepID=A0ACB8XPF9_ARCLA|nr:hypothetical protein L6452_41089 [Arctium lappa]
MMWEEVTQFYVIDARMKERMMHHIAYALRNFRSKVYKRFILPNIGKPSKLKVVPKQYGNVEQDDWDKFFERTLSDQFKAVSESAKISRAKHKCPHRLGRSGYMGFREKMVKNKEILDDEVPVRSLMWCKACQSKDGGYENDELKDKTNEIVNHEKEIQDGSLTLEHGTNALTLVFGKEHSGHVRRVGKEVTPTRYWNKTQRIVQKLHSTKTVGR